MSVHASTGRTYSDTEQTPVPFPAYRCKATVTVRSQHYHQVLRKHLCKITIDHDQEHACICGYEWPKVGDEEDA